MLKKINSWHLSVLVLVASVLGLVLVQQQVLAQWQNPTDTPGQAGDSSLVLNPLVEDVDLSGSKFTDSANATFVLEPGGVTGMNITGTGYGINATGATYAGYFNGDMHVTGDLTVDGSSPGGAGGGFWLESPTDPGDIYYDGGYVGIGTSDPAAPLHIIKSGSQLKVTPDYIWHLSNSRFKISSGGDVSIRPDNSESASSTFSELGRLGIRVEDPGYPLHVRDDDSTSILNIDNQDGHLWTGTRLERDDQEKWFIGMDNTTDTLNFRANNATNTVSINIDSNEAELTLESYERSFINLLVSDPWVTTIDNVGIDFTRNNWATDQYTDYRMLVNNGDFILNSYYQDVYNPVPAIVGTPLFIRDIGLGTGGNSVAGYMGINKTDPSAQLHVYDDEAASVSADGGIAILGNNDNASGGVGVIGLQTNGSGIPNAIGALGMSGPNGFSSGNLDIGVFGAVTNDTALGVYGYNNSTPGGGGDYTDKSVGVLGQGHWAVVGDSTTSNGRGVYAEGYYGVKARSTVAGGYAIYGEEGSGDYAGKFVGDVWVASGGDLKIDDSNANTPAYLRLDVTSTVPNSVDCDSDVDEPGRMVFDNTANVIYICTGNTTGWQALFPNTVK